MPITQILYNLLLMPLQMLFEAVYRIAYSFIGNPGITIIIFSLTINFLILPLYRRADALQEEERNIEQKLSRGVRHIKKTFRGDEQMMMLQTYYRQNGYKPTYVLRGATSLMLEIPFFIVAYRFLSNLDLLQGVSFGPIADLGKPDGILTIAGVTINILPIIMTAVNLVSSFLFTRGYSVKTKVQLYGMAVFFLVFLYTSPSGLVFYWTLNNAFSLIKTIFYKLRQPRRVLNVLSSLVGVGAVVLGLTAGAERSAKWEIFFCVAGVLLQLPLLTALLRSKAKAVKKEAHEYVDHPKVFFGGAVFLAVLTGLIIPSSVIAASPQEFIVPGYMSNPIWYLVSSCCLAVGTFVVWFGVFYSLADKRSRSYIEKAAWMLCGVVIVNYMFFGKDLGLIGNSLQYENGMSFSAGQQLANLAIILGTAAIMWLIHRLIKKRVFDVIVIATLALCGLAIVNVAKISTSVSQVSVSGADEGGALHSLSKNGKNVVVLMLDRGINEYIPYIMNEKPELKEQFDGFTYYSNTIAYAPFTNMAIPAVFGGYEYTPAENSKRDSESLESKHNEALKVMPVLFSKNGYRVTVCQPTYAGYQWTPDLSIYDDYPEIKTYNPTGMYSSELETRPLIEGNMRNFFAFGITKVAPLFAQPALYEDGLYNYVKDSEAIELTQTTDGILRSTGISNTFLNNYNVLHCLPTITSVTDDEQNTFMMLSNDATHEPCMLQMPDYTPEQKVDNSAYADQLANGYVVDGRKLKMENERQVTHYQSNMAAMLQLGRWFDYLRENGVYDNTKIIIVSDHGRNIRQMDEAIYHLINDEEFDSEYFRALLMVKDFNATGFTSSDEFMTQADTPTLAFGGLIDDPVNPFTGKVINNSEKTAHDQYIFESHIWDVGENNGNVFRPGNWFALRPGDSWDESNWRFVTFNSVLPEEAK